MYTPASVSHTEYSQGEYSKNYISEMLHKTATAPCYFDIGTLQCFAPYVHCTISYSLLYIYMYSVHYSIYKRTFPFVWCWECLSEMIRFCSRTMSLVDIRDSWNLFLIDKSVKVAWFSLDPILFLSSYFFFFHKWGWLSLLFEGNCDGGAKIQQLNVQLSAWPFFLF